MAILTALFSALAKKAGDFLQAVFGWSIAALFGRLNSKKQILISIALIFSLLWPVFIVGVIFPAAATFIVAFIPVKGMLSESVLRVVWIGLAVLAPVIVGILTRVVSADARKDSFFMSIINGYPLAIGFATSFLIALITVPLLKISTIARRWDEEHLFVQAKKDKYRDAMKALCEACAMAGLEPKVEPVPKSMALATRVIKLFSRGAVDSLITAHPMMIRNVGLEVYLYPADLLLRGEKVLVGKVRSAINRTMLEKDAYLMESEEGQHLQDEVGHLMEAIDRHDSAKQIDPSLKTRVKEIVDEGSKKEISFEESVLLERMARKVEDRLSSIHSVIEEAGVKKTFEEVHAMSEGADSKKVVSISRPVSPLKSSKNASDMSTAQLVESAFTEARELVKIEMALAKEEMTREMKDAARAASGFALAAICVVLMLSLLGMSLVLVLGGTAVVALSVAGGFLVVGGVAGAVGYSMLPTAPMKRTRAHVSNDIKQLREHVA